MPEIYSNRVHGDVPRRVRLRITANVQSIIEQHGDNPDQQEDMIEDLIDVAYDSYHVGWQAGFIDDTQPDPKREESIMEALEMLKNTIDEFANFNPGGTK